MFARSHGIVLGLLAAATPALLAPAPARAAPWAQVPIFPVARDEIVAAMRAESGYDIRKTTHAGRFQGSVYLRLMRAASEQGYGSSVLRLDHADWFEAFLEVTGTARNEAPVHILGAYESRQSAYLDGRPDAVVARVRSGPSPRMAVNVRLSWPDWPGAPEEYSFEDRLSVPVVQVHNARVVTFRLLDFGDWMMFDEVEGSRIRPTTGALGALFRVIGLAQVTEVRMTASAEGVAVARATARKLLLRVHETVTVLPDGTADRGLPDDRPELRRVEARLRRDLDVDYVPLAWERVLTS